MERIVDRARNKQKESHHANRLSVSSEAACERAITQGGHQEEEVGQGAA